MKTTLEQGRVWAVVSGMALVVAVAGRSASAQTPAPPPGVQATAVEETVVVVGVTPVAGLGIDRRLIPSNVQTWTSDALTRVGGISAVEQLSLAAGSVQINDATTNPLQPDLQFRGFTASPLLGLPQGLAVYQNGVRLNEPFGDSVNWDLLPTQAIAGINLMPGSNPLFGLNALGGAISVQTKTGFSHPGHTLTTTGGSFGRYVVDGSSGGHAGRFSYFVAGSALSEDGWRDFSSSDLRQVFGDVGYRGARTTLNATLTMGRNRLIGNGAAPLDLLDEDRSAIFTHPDQTRTRMTMLTLSGRQARGASLTLEGSVYFRRAAIGTLNGDDSDYDECEAEPIAAFLCEDDGDGDVVLNQFGDFIDVDEDDEFNGTNNTSETVSNGFGGTLQATVVAPLAGRPNHLVAGVTFDGGRSRYEAATEIARLNDDRGTDGSGFFDAEAAVGLKTVVRHTGFFVADFLTIAPRLTVMGAARFNVSTVRLRDQIDDDLDGDHRFTRINPAAGLAYELASGPTLFGSFSMSSRVPAPSELSCADPEDPCRLPNAFLSDPPLEQVVAATWEGGVRGSGRGISWNASAFRTANTNDIMFISSGPVTNTGHFENVANTVRQGLELGASGAAQGLQWSAAYSFLQARFDTGLTVSSPNHPEGVDGEIAVDSGSRIPGLPQHNLKLNATGTIGRLTLGGGMLATSSQYLRGDEANLLPAIDGFSVVNMMATYQVSPSVRLKARVTNLLGANYETFGLLGEPGEVLGDDYDDPRFLSPGPPRAAWFGVELSFR